MAKRKLDAIRITTSRPAVPPAQAVPAAPDPAELEPPELDPAEEDPTEDDYEEAGENAWQRSPLWLRFLGSGITLMLLLVGSFELVYAGKIMPGVSADGVYLGGLSRADAQARLADKTKDFAGHVVTISNGDTNLRIPVSGLTAAYNPAKAADLAFSFGREGDLWNRLHQQARALVGRATPITTMTYDADRLTPYIVDFDNDLVTPVQDADLSFNDNRAQVTPAGTGTRLDTGRLVQLVMNRLATTSSDPIIAPVYQLKPDLDTAPLAAAIDQLNTYLSGPLTLSYNGTDRTVDQNTIISWIQAGAKAAKPFLNTLKVEDLYPPPPSATIRLDHQAVAAYVDDLAKGIDQTAQNAALSMDSGNLAVVQPSRNGVKLDRDATIKAIEGSLTKSSDDRRVSLKLQTTTADVNENNLEQLGIKELISEGETYFPGSPSTRLTNVRAGASKFNGVVLKPGETFSFGKLLGDVGPETGYVPELVILADHEEKQYGGGLCQVSSTAFRAALAAGLPITERHNHSFAISYYTWPYSAPGVDATIYYPQVDFKFVNDTGHYLLIQTTMKGTDLKFDFFGTKTKSGVIRGPQFISGDSDTTKPSHTVFYRDVLDMDGKVTKTDTFNTYYKSSKDFPVQKEFN
jgi:vancomycin resistance protein YoaR